MKKLDQIDYQILDILQKNGRITNQELASKVELAPSSTLLRVRQLEEAGCISGYHAKINLKNIYHSVTCIAGVNLKSHTQHEFEAFKQVVESIPEVVECYTVSGECDFILKIVCRDMPAYLTINDKLISSPSYSATINTFVVMDENKPFTQVELSTLA